MPADPLISSVHIDAPLEQVFEHFVNPEAIVGWMGDYAVLEPTPGGAFTLDINGVPVRGSYLELDPPRRLLISWGHAGSERLPPGSSTVEIRLSPHRGGTLVEVIHSGLPVPEAEQHANGWEHFLARLAELAAGRDPGPDPWAIPTRRPGGANG
jgi:uncharacterized protein YndB with AHSA1/START domain